jgi:serine/threonine-protein kinase
MADQWTGGQASSGERWNVNLPAVVGVVFVFLLGVVIWVVASSGDDGGDAIRSVESSTTPAPTPAPPTTPPPTTTPPPLPSTTPAPSIVPAAPSTPAPTPVPTAAPTAPAATVPPPTAAPAPTTTIATSSTSTTRAPDGSGDLGVEGHPIRRPECNGDYITVIASAVGDDASGPGLGIVLDQYPGSNYLRTDVTCPSLTQSVDGEPVYVVYFGPFDRDVEACGARADGPDGAYVRRLSDDLEPNHSVTCT